MWLNKLKAKNKFPSEFFFLFFPKNYTVHPQEIEKKKIKNYRKALNLGPL
jgi:hypothetical protein